MNIDDTVGVKPVNLAAVLRVIYVDILDTIKPGLSIIIKIKLPVIKPCGN